jgi:hypothetical protein
MKLMNAGVDAGRANIYILRVRGRCGILLNISEILGYGTKLYVD